LTEQERDGQAAKAAFKALRAKAQREHGGNTQPLLVVYALECFLRRLAMSEHAERMVLKGGMLMAANDIRRMTRDADLSTRGIANDEEKVRQVVTEICSVTPDRHDGIVIDPTTIKTEVMREEAEYQGLRCKLVAALGQARIAFALDFSFGDPDEPTVITLESVIDQPDVRLQAYPLALNLAEKIVTAMQRRETSTRDRDFADLWVTSRRHAIDATELMKPVQTVARHRGQNLISMAEALRNLPDRQQSYAAMVQRMSYLSPPPQRWTELIDGVIAFVDPLLNDSDGRFSHWDPGLLEWAPADASPSAAV
jgi:predicted nucleotidyltransferase component of viral defense system